MAGDYRRDQASWTVQDPYLELRRFEQELQAAGLRENIVTTYVNRSETFIRWLAGEYKPRGPMA